MQAAERLQAIADSLPAPQPDDLVLAMTLNTEVGPLIFAYTEPALLNPIQGAHLKEWKESGLVSGAGMVMITRSAAETGIANHEKQMRVLREAFFTLRRQKKS